MVFQHGEYSIERNHMALKYDELVVKREWVTGSHVLLPVNDVLVTKRDGLVSKRDELVAIFPVLVSQSDELHLIIFI